MDRLPTVEHLRIDKWLWAARLYKTRALAADEVGRGRVLVNGSAVKPARELKVGDEVTVRQQTTLRVVLVQALSPVRGPAPLAQTLYVETPESLQARQQAAEARRLAAEPALAIEHGRPTKRDRRDIDRSRWQRWSASIDDE